MRAFRSSTIAAAHPTLFRQLRETGARMTITLIPGNHDYDLACVPEYAAELARYNVRLEPVVSITRIVAGRKVWIEHGNQYDDEGVIHQTRSPLLLGWKILNRP